VTVQGNGLGAQHFFDGARAEALIKPVENGAEDESHCLAGTRHDNVFTLQAYLERLKRPWWRTTHISPLQIIGAVVARAPDLVKVIPVLHSAVKMSAGGEKGSPFVVGCVQKKRWLAPKLEYLSRIPFHFSDFCRYD